MSGVSEIVALRPSMVLQLQVGSSNGRPTYSEFSYEEIVQLLARPARPSKSRRSTTVEAKASRLICLMARAITTGKWTTGASVSVENTYDKLVSLVDELSDDVVEGLSDKAKTSISNLLAYEYAGTSMRVFQTALRNAYVRDIEP